MPDNKIDLAPTLFLDTNVLVYLWSYLVKAKGLSLPPYPGTNFDLSQISLKLKETLPDSIVDPYIKGCKSLAFLQGKAIRQDGEIVVQIYTSRLSKVEMLNGALDGKAHILMAQQGIPYRMRQRASNLSDLISTRLRREDIDETVNTANEIIELLKTKDSIFIDYVEDTQPTNEIARLAEFLSSRIYLDVLDIWMYACALSIQADQVLCFDNYFTKVIRRINTGGDDWAKVKKEITVFLKDQWGWNKVIFPKVQNNLPGTTPLLWS